MTKKRMNGFAAKARRLLKARERGKQEYGRATTLLKQMRADGLKPNDEILINAKGDKVVLLDLYEKDDKVFRAHGIDRYELKLLEAKP